MVKHIRPVVMWLEVAIAILTASIAIFAIYQAVFYGHHDPQHGGAFLLMSGFMFAGIAIAFGGVAAGLWMNWKFGWFFQILPLTLFGWFLWETILGL